MKRQKRKANTPKPAPPGTVSGDEAKRRMARVNSDYATVHRIMTEPGPRWEPQPSLGREPWRGHTRRFE